MNDSVAAQTDLTETTAEIVAAYVSRNHVQPSEMPTLIRTVHDTLSTLGTGQAAEAEPVKLTPPVSIRKSITDDYLISLEDGKRYQALKRHLTKLGLTPAEYRAKWGLPKDYPMVAPAYSARRSELAKTIGLGRKAVESASEPASVPEPEAEDHGAPDLAAKPKRSRKAA